MAQGMERAVRRSRQYWYDDGLTEFGAGIMFLAVSLLFLVEAYAEPGSLPGSFSAIGIVLIAGGGIWLVKWAVNQAKQRITYPRTGYLRYRREERSPRRRVLVAILAIAIAALTAGALSRTAPASLNWIPALQGIFIGSFIVVVAYFAGVARLYLLGGLSLVAGPAISLAGFGDTHGNGIYFAVMGVALLLSGSVTLLSYLRRAQPSEVE